MNTYDRIKECRMIPVIALDNVSDAKPLAKALYEGGLPCAEVTFRREGADLCIKAMKEEYPDMLVGAGTVLSIKQVDAALNAGAQFIVSPGLDEDIVSYCLEKNVCVIPGVSTASDVAKAHALGLRVVKFFPAEAAGGVKMLKALSAPYNMMTFMPTGGISMDNMASYYALKNVIACGGSFMIDAKSIKEGDFDTIKNRTVEVVGAIDRIINGGSDKSKTVSIDTDDKKIDMSNLSNSKVITFGELMLRLAPQGYLRFVQADTFEATFGGGEANVSISLANYGMNTSFVTKLPNHEIGQMSVNSLRKYGVDTSLIVRGGSRVGIYYLEKGASQRASKVIYDRAGSAIAEASKTDFDWDKIFDNAGWFHFTGITPALSDELADITLEACKKAKEKGIIVSCDLNYRNKLWSKEKAGEVMEKLCRYVDVCISNEEDAYDVFKIKAPDTDVTAGEINSEGYKYVAEELKKRFGFSYVAITLRESISASDNRWGAMLYDGKDYYFSKKYNVHIVDRVGGGDSFGAGLVYSLTHNYTSADAIEFAVAASCLKHSIEGDYNFVSVDEVNKLAKGDASGRVQR
ncbi:MAG: bifunctional 4-hydroxy-2-oxoglutarate aldolase/2-dehydro-3-deoxy-phosphogluconate aldolase [Lachnospiraceae bacterium]|nr:bifunctional 4-hydroxy-2-oxoglutarate aldolase/2-dehydro-3-deoxy-phosphogluconate aldolase [Lachnospiraceae bacterium]